MKNTIKERSINDLGFQTVLHEVSKLCLSEEGRETVIQQDFVLDTSTLADRQDCIEDFIRLASYRDFSPVSFPPINSIQKELKIPNRALDGLQLYELGEYLQAARTFIDYCRMPRKMPGEAESVRHEEVFPTTGLFSPFDHSLNQLLTQLFETLDSPGEVKPSHPAIARLVREVERKRNERQRYSQDFLKKQQSSEVNIQPVFRDGRVILPVRSDQKATTDGIIHSYSSSGSTIFIEPYRLVELNNQVVMAQQQIHIEIARILYDLSEKARKVIEEISLLSQQIAYADSLYARSLYADRHQCVRPICSHSNSVKLIKARHPLLHDSAVPITLELDSDCRAVVISGPNAGGKTVTIKTVGLFALMHQSIYFVPAEEGTEMPLYSQVFTDIGDDQSIVESLSTFSGHMKNIGSILRDCTHQSLVILDELGSGTDPIEGSALARSILEYCVDHAALTLVTSHHSVLKQYAYAHKHILNASMEFDAQTHEPTFKVISGLPGESHALDTARRMALPESVLEQATSYLGSEVVEISTIIRNLEERRKEAELRERALDDRAKRLQEEVRKIDLKSLSVKQQEELVRKEQIGDLSRFISQKRKELENLVSELREGEITKEKTKKVKAFIASMEHEKQLNEEKARKISQKVREKQPEASVSGEPFAVGMDVLVGPQRREGRIVRKEKKGKWLVAIGPMKFPIEEHDLKHLTHKRKQDNKKVSIAFDSRSTTPRPTIDVRGMTLDQALEQVSIQIEGALVHAMQEFSIIHGMGDGILARGIHEYLNSVPQVSKFQFARPEDGGFGKTYVVL